MCSNSSCQNKLKALKISSKFYQLFEDWWCLIFHVINSEHLEKDDFFFAFTQTLTSKSIIIKLYNTSSYGTRLQYLYNSWVMNDDDRRALEFNLFVWSSGWENLHILIETTSLEFSRSTPSLVQLQDIPSCIFKSLLQKPLEKWEKKITFSIIWRMLSRASFFLLEESFPIRLYNSASNLKNWENWLIIIQLIPLLIRLGFYIIRVSFCFAFCCQMINSVCFNITRCLFILSTEVFFSC